MTHTRERTVNEPETIAAALDLGVDGSICDRPDRVRAAMARRGQAVPKRFERMP